MIYKYMFKDVNENMTFTGTTIIPQKEWWQVIKEDNLLININLLMWVIIGICSVYLIFSVLKRKLSV